MIIIIARKAQVSSICHTHVWHSQLPALTGTLSIMASSNLVRISILIKKRDDKSFGEFSN
jgi:hypothetical protein